MRSSGEHRDEEGRAGSTRRGLGLRGAAMGIGLATAVFASRAAAEPPPPRPAAVLATAAKDEQIKRAKVLNDEAEELYSHGQYRAAIAKLEEALKLDPDGKVLVYDLAVAHERLAEFETAEKYYRRYLEMESDPKVRERIEGVLQRLDGAKQELASLPARSKSASRSVSPWLFPAVGVAGVALCVGVGLGIGAVVTNPGANTKTGNGVSVADLQRDAQMAHREAVAADISFLISAVAAGAAVYLYFRAPLATSQSAPQGAHPRVAVDVGVGRAALRVLF